MMPQPGQPGNRNRRAKATKGKRFLKALSLRSSARSCTCPRSTINGPFPEPSAPDRHCHITRKLTFTVAIFRSWRGSRAFAVWNPSFTTSGTGWYHQPGPLAGIQPAGGDLRFGRGPRALRLARQRRGRDSNSRSFRIRTFQARAIDQLGDLSKTPPGE